MIETKYIVKGLYVYGAGYHGRVLSDLMRNDGYSITGFIDDYSLEEKVNGIEVRRFNPKFKHIMIGIGSDKTIPYKIRLYNKLKHYEIYFPTYINTWATVSNTAHIGVGVQIFPNAVINHKANIGKFVIINTGAIVEHDCDIGDFSSISPGAVLCGNVTVGKGTFIGANTTIINNVRIGDNCIVGAGSTVIKNVPDNTVVVGCPARKIKDKNVESIKNTTS